MPQKLNKYLTYESAVLGIDLRAVKALSRQRFIFMFTVALIIAARS